MDDGITRCNSVLLSSLSPFLKQSISFGRMSNTSIPTKLDLEHVRRAHLERLLDLATGRSVLKSDEDAMGLLPLATTAALLQMHDAARILEDAVIHRLTLDACTELLAGDSGATPHAAAAARAAAAAQLEAAAATQHFPRISADGLLALLDEPALDPAAASPELESAVQRAAMLWLAAAAAASPGGGLDAPGPRAVTARLRLRRYQRLRVGGPPDGPRQVREPPAEAAARATLLG
jgi:hypothetical protein